jgi:hypothetical protein
MLRDFLIKVMNFPLKSVTYRADLVLLAILAQTAGN